MNRRPFNSNISCAISLKQSGLLSKNGSKLYSAKAGKDAGSAIALKDYVRFQLGEGIEKEVSDFAAEVAAAVAG